MKYVYSYIVKYLHNYYHTTYHIMNDESLFIEIKGLFGIEHENEASIVFDVIKKNKNMIVGCGTSFFSFAEYCKAKIDKQYEKFPEKKFVNITFEQVSLGFDNWEIEPIFYYE